MRKTHLPKKVCTVCGRPFSWRKKWANCWAEVKYCSERCRRQKNTKKPSFGSGTT
ncbi:MULTISPECIES: DUF2256 domain-containing protein [Thermonema]|uniref:DUF2256 domain-containing protein n=1 Tax=Thermonema TaxID=28194 RepID=UPI0008FFA96E|nr:MULTISPECIES: DUF2256 domain-containing protein [Thermonema]